MKIELAGYNVDSDILARLNPDHGEVLTPETFSAAYARISRSPEDVTSLRRQAREDVERARKSNQKIIFEMGHHSVAEHAVFNFDVMGVSRLALEALEHFRLVSYTEKSQRYVTLEGDHVLPVELKHDEPIRLFRDTVGRQNEFYRRAFSRLKTHVFEANPERSGKKRHLNELEGWAKEDARYVLPLATAGQVGITANARNIEHMLRRFRLSPLGEVREMGDRIFKLVTAIAPSIILFSEPSELESRLSTATGAPPGDDTPRTPADSGVKIIDCTEEADERILAAMLAVRRSEDHDAVLARVRAMSTADRASAFRDIFEKMEFFDTPPRAFELPALTFQAVLSASNFAQIKRHRLATLLPGPYHVDLGHTTPESFAATGLADEFADIVDRTNEAHRRLSRHNPRAADYVLTNAHHRLVIMKMNLRELYHFIRLRDDVHAQWDIKAVARALRVEVRRRMPLASLLLCGKSDFAETYASIFKARPKFKI